MSQTTTYIKNFSRLYWYVTFAALGWLLLILLSLAWHISTENGQTMELAKKEATTIFNKDVALRLWATTHGGVYVQVSEHTQPSPFLLNVSERDIVTPLGKKLTLMNPAYMIRQIMSDYGKSYGVMGHLTSLRLLNEGNKPDAWERNALGQFEKGATEVVEQVLNGGDTYLRLMRPLVTKEGCLTCHGDLGYKVGDIRGGVSVSVPMNHYLEWENHLNFVSFITHALLWLFGTLFIGFIGSRSKKRIIESRRAQAEILQLNLDLESRIKERTEDLEGARDQVTLLMDALPIIPYTRNVADDLAFSYMGGRIKKISGFSAKEFIDEPEFWFNHLHHEDRKRVMGEVEKMAKLGTLQHEYRMQTRDGSYCWIRDTMRLVGTSQGVNKYIAGTWQDISEEISLRQDADLRPQQVIQADKLASLGLVVAGVAHEINNPNSFITYNTPLLADTWETFKPIVAEYGNRHEGWQKNGMTIAELSQDMEEIIQAIDTGSGRINKVVQNLKDFARMDEGLHSEEVDINEVINKTLIIVGAQLRKMAGKIELNLDENLPRIKGHSQKLEQVMANFFLNAGHAIIDKKGGVISISSRYLPRIDYVLLEVDDNGLGIGPESLQKIFDPFFTTKRDSGGTGLGLSVSASLVKEHQGMIRVISQPGFGTKFSIMLPVDSQQVRPQIVPSILFVDDDPIYTVFFDELFSKREGLTFHTLNDPTQVLPYLEEHPEVALIFSDIQMPNLSGWQLLDAVKARFPRLPFIIFSGDSDLEGKQSDKEPEQVLKKPLSKSIISDIIYKFSRYSIWIS